MAIIQIDDGTREYEIQNKYGETICKLHFRPGDLSLLNRWQETRDSFAETVKPLEELDINADGTAADEAGIAALQEAEQRFRTALGKLIDSRDIGAIFDTRSPFASVGGRFFAEARRHHQQRARGRGRSVPQAHGEVHRDRGGRGCWAAFR